MLLVESANFGEKVFGDPEHFRIDRYPDNHPADSGLISAWQPIDAPGAVPDMRLSSDDPSPMRPAHFVGGSERVRCNSPDGAVGT
ncbi:hypothetical protein ACX9NE_01240 [Mycobacterium sp. ML4]